MQLCRIAAYHRQLLGLNDSQLDIFWKGAGDDFLHFPDQIDQLYGGMFALGSLGKRQ